MPSIFKRLLRTDTSDYVFPSVQDLMVEEPSAAPPEETADATEPEPEPEVQEALSPEEEKLRYADIQAKAILEDARREAEAIKEKALQEAEDELKERRRKAREEGYSHGFAEGMAEASQEARIQREQQAAELADEVRAFLEAAAREKAKLLDDTMEEMKDMALAIAEKVIRVSLRGSNEVLLRMVEAATDTHKRCEWAHIYVADCDLNSRAQSIPELTAALAHLSDRVKVIPMADDESGTCIVELPDVIMDASVSTQLGNIREVLNGAGVDRDGDQPFTISLK